MDTKRLILELAGVSAYYGHVRVLEGINLKVGLGESVAILGANGSGKTSLFRAMSGIMVRRSGHIAFDGVEISRLQPHAIVRLGISHIPEGKHLFPPLTVQENLEMGALLLHSGRRNKEVVEMRNLVFQLFPILSERKRQQAGTLSGGEQQMLAIGRAIMSHPRVLLLDEPSTGLGPLIIEHLLEALRTLKKLGLTILLAEQNVPLGLGLAEHGVVLSLGRIAIKGSASELANNAEVRRIYLGGD